MAGKRLAPLSGGLFDLSERVELWRRTRKKLGPMPEALWEEAAQVSHREGASRVAHALRLDYKSLKRRMERCSGKGQTSRAQFVELELWSPASQGPCVVQLERPDGGRMKIRLPGTGEVVALSRAFWSGER